MSALYSSEKHAPCMSQTYWQAAMSVASNPKSKSPWLMAAHGTLSSRSSGTNASPPDPASLPDDASSTPDDTSSVLAGALVFGVE